MYVKRVALHLRFLSAVVSILSPNQPWRHRVSGKLPVAFRLKIAFFGSSSFVKDSWQGTGVSEARSVVSTRWSYGPDGLRERPVERRRSVGEYLPPWRELQPILLRSAGVVGLVATIMAVVSSDAFHFGGEPAALEAEGALAVTVDRAVYEPMAAPVAEGEIFAESQTPGVAEIPDLRTDAPPAPAATDPETTASVDTPAETVVPDAEGPTLAPAVADLRTTVPEQAVLPAAAAPVASAEAPVGGPMQPPEAAAPRPEAAATPPAEPAPIQVSASTASKEIKLASLQPVPAPAIDDGATERFEWPTGAEECVRDWIHAERDGDAGSTNCTTTDVLIASVEENEQPALQEAATEHAEMLASLARLPRPRPDPPADFKPSNPHATRVSSNRNSSWPPEPPPNCAAGQHAKWRFVDRRAGTKEWYCK